MITRENGLINTSSITGITARRNYGDLKALHPAPFTMGSFRTDYGVEFRYFIETGKAAMIMIYGVQTLLNIQEQ